MTESKEKKVYEKTIRISQARLDFINRALSEAGHMGEDDTASESAHFDNGMVMDVKCCGSQDEPAWTEAVLFTHGLGDYSNTLFEVAHTDPSDEFTGDWEIEYDGDTYRVTVEVET